MVSHLEGLTTLAMVWVIGAGSMAGVVFAREGVAREEMDARGEDGSGEVSQPLDKWCGLTIWW